MRGVAVILLALALEVPYRASYRLQTPTRPSAAVRITPMLTKRVLAMSSLKNLPLIAVSRQRRKISPSKSIFRWLVKEWRRTRSATYFIASITMQILALIAPSRFPGGHIFVGAGVLAYVDSEDQLAVVLGHEIEHIALNHCHDRLAQLLSDSHLSVTDAAKLKIEDFFLGYGHDRELAADREGVKLAMSAGYNGNAGVRLLQMFVILAQQRPRTSTENEERIKERIAQMQSLARAQASSPAETSLGLH
jgi:Zn-dependent protease with chaperone function